MLDKTVSLPQGQLTLLFVVDRPLRIIHSLRLLIVVGVMQVVGVRGQWNGHRGDSPANWTRGR